MFVAALIRRLSLTSFGFLCRLEGQGHCAVHARLSGARTLARGVSKQHQERFSVKSRRMHKWFRRGLKIMLALLILFVGLNAGYFVWLRLAPPPALPQSMLLKTPIHLQAITGRGLVNISWDEIPNAMSYQVLRSEHADRDFVVAGSPFGSSKYGAFKWTGSLIFDRWAARTFPDAHFGRIPHSPFVDTHIQVGHRYYYRVRTTDGTGWTEPSPPVQIVIPFNENYTAPTVHIVVDATQNSGELQHIWEAAVGSERLSYMLNSDLNSNLTEVGEGLRRGNELTHTELGIRYVITHSILNDNMGIYREDPNGNPIYDWTGIDTVYDKLRADGLKPFVQLDFMPSALASNPKLASVFYRNPAYYANDSPPKDYRKWSALVASLANHLIQRYGRQEVESWPFQVWNEPDVCIKMIRVCYWQGSEDDYFRLYDYAAQALKSVDPQLHVGGPVSLFSAFVERFLKHITTHNYATGGTSTPLDFLDVRSYQTAAENWQPMLKRYGLEHLPVYYTEWGVREQIGDPVNDMPYGAAWVARSMHDSIDQASLISLWTASDYFEEQGNPKTFFHGGFGMIGLDGVRKPRFWASYLLHQMGTHQLALHGDGDGFGGIVTGWATVGGDNSIRILLSNVTYDQNDAEGNPLLARHISLSVAGLAPGKSFHFEHFRVDNEHSNVYDAWNKIGRPNWPSSAQLSELHNRDALETLDPADEIKADAQGHAVLEFELPMPALTLLLLAPIK
jgi:xylan 1,4-beta-xylosidase